MQPKYKSEPPPDIPETVKGVHLSSIPVELKGLPQWVAWRYVSVPGRNKPTKPPFQSANPGLSAKCDDPSTWSSFELAVEALINDKHRRGGIGFQFSHDDSYSGVDYDNCRDPQTGEIKPWAQQALDLLGATYTEVSPSGTGLHAICKGKLPPGGRKHTRADGGVVEMYDQGRYFTVTGNRLPDTPAVINDCQDGLNKLHARLFPGKPKPTKPTPPPTESFSLSDSEIIDKACNCRKTGSAFQSLWNGGAGNDHSAADLSLCLYLVFWCSGDMAQVDRLFRASGLMRDKWDKRHSSDGKTYGELTLAKVVSSATNAYTKPTPKSQTNRQEQMMDDGYFDSLLNGDPAQPREIKETPKPKPTGMDAIVAKALEGICSADEFLKIEFPPIRWAIEGILPSGLTIFAGSPKVGKSQMALNIAFAIASGGVALGTEPVEQGEVLYVSRDDSRRRLQDRLKAAVEADRMMSAAPASLHLVFNWPVIGQGCAEALDAWLTTHPACRLVVMDVLKHFRAPSKGKRSGREDYEDDYQLGEALKVIAEKHNVAILVIHHCTKLAYQIAEGDDPIQSVAGTTGLTGSADNLMVLYKRAGTADAFLHICGNDTETVDKALNWDKPLATWLIAGEAEDYKGSDQWQAIRSLLQSSGPLSAIDITRHFYPGVDTKSKEHDRVKFLVRKYLRQGLLKQRSFDKRYTLSDEVNPSSNASSTNEHREGGGGEKGM